MTLLIIWGLSLASLLVLLARGYLRLHLAPVSYEFHWNPVRWASSSAGAWFQRATLDIKARMHQALHSIFHSVFHVLKRFHDRIFGKRLPLEGRTPSFFLKTIAEHKEERIGEREMLS